MRHARPWCISGSLTRGGEENVPGIPGACATRNFAYLARGPWAWLMLHQYQQKVTGSETKRHVGVDLYCDSIMHKGECSRLHTESVAGSWTLCSDCMLNMRNDNYRPMTVMFGQVFQTTPILIRCNSRQGILAHRTFMKMLLNRSAMAIHYQAP